MTIKLIQTDSDFLEKAGTKVTDGMGNEWFHLPYWYRKTKDGLYEEVTFIQLPEALKETLEKRRTGI